MNFFVRHRGVLLTLAVGLTVYGLIWSVSAVLALRDLRSFFDSIPTGPIPPISKDLGDRLVLRIRRESFEQDRFHPAKDQEFIYFGRFRSPAPFLVTLDFAFADDRGGYASRKLYGWRPGEWSLLKEKIYWQYGDLSRLSY